MNMKIAATGIAAGIIGAINSVTTSLFDVSGVVPFLAFTGALLSYGYEIEGYEIPKRGKKFYFVLTTNALAATAAVSVFPHFFGWEWYDPKMQGSVAFLMALGGRFIVPIFFKLLPEIVRKWFKVGEYKQVKKEDPNEIK